MLALFLTALALAPPPSLPAVAARDSLEEFLRKARTKKEERMAALQGPVAEMVVRLETRGKAGSRREMERLRRELDALGIEAAPLLIPLLDPGSGATAATRFRAEEIAGALIRMHTALITQPLVEIAQQPDARARLLAIRVLGHAPDRARASRALTEIFRATRGTVRQTCVVALSNLGGEENANVLREALEDESPDVVGAVLDALAAAQVTDALDGVRALLLHGKCRTQVVPQLLGYFTACAAAVDQDAVCDLVRFAAAGGLGKDERIAVLGAVPDFEPDLDGEMRDALAPLLVSADAELVEEAQICLALLGDRGVRRDLKRKYEDLIREQNGWYSAFEKRGTVLLKLREYTDAAKDFRRAIEAREGRRQAVPRELFVDLARAFVLGGKLRQAHDTLKEAFLSRGQLRQVAEDPDFAELVEHSRYGKIFE